MPSLHTLNSPVLIVGTGAMACLFAARLAASGNEVMILGTWIEGMEALRTHGVRLIEEDGSVRSFPVQVVSDPVQCVQNNNFRRIGLALVLVKSWQTERAGKQLHACLDQAGLALTLQNGLGNYDVLVEKLGIDRVALGVTTTGATLVEAGLVKPVGSSTVSVGDHPRLNPMIDMLCDAGFQTEMISDMESLQWGKLVINAAINPLTALLRVPNGELLLRPSVRTLLSSIAIESATVAVSQGIHLPYPDAVGAVESVAHQTATNYSSMLRDVQRGASTEIDAINAAIVRAGDRLSIPTPVNRTMWQLVKGIGEKDVNENNHNAT